MLSRTHVNNILLEKGSLIYDAQMPRINQSTGETIGFHIRMGKHDITKYDWVQFLNFTDKFFK